MTNGVSHLECKLEKMVFPYEGLTSYDKLRSHDPVKPRDFYRSLKKKNTLTPGVREVF